MKRPAVAYLMSRFPHLPETFILREMSALEQCGWQIALYPLILQKPSVIHADAKPWMPRAHRLSWASTGMLAANGQALARRPHRYGALWGLTLWENRTSLNFLMRAIVLLPLAVHAARLMRQEGVTHIHAHYATHPALVAWLIHRLTGMSYSLTVHAHDIFVRQTMLAAKLREASFVVAISEYNRDYLARVAGAWAKSKTHVIHCGIDPSQYAPRPRAHRPDERFEMVSIGSLQPYKGHRYLIEACAMLRDRHIPLRCRIVGGGEERAALERMIARARLDSVVELMGPLPQEEVARILPTAHCYVQPSIVMPSGKMEGIPVALMEALACALPVVATNISGVPEIVRPNQTGRLVPPADGHALANALAEVQADPDNAFQMARAGRAVVLREFELQANVQRLATLFEQATLAQPAWSGPDVVPADYRTPGTQTRLSDQRG